MYTYTHSHTQTPSSTVSKLKRHTQNAHECVVRYTPPPWKHKWTHAQLKHTRGAQLIMGPLIKKNDARFNCLLDEDGGKSGIWTKGGPLRLSIGTDQQLMAAAPSVY